MLYAAGTWNELTKSSYAMLSTTYMRVIRMLAMLQHGLDLPHWTTLVVGDLSSWRNTCRHKMGAQAANNHGRAPDLYHPHAHVPSGGLSGLRHGSFATLPRWKLGLASPSEILYRQQADAALDERRRLRNLARAGRSRFI